MATLIVPTNTDFSGSPLNDIDEIDFTNGLSTTATATFAASQFDNVDILNTVLLDGSLGTAHIVVNGGSVNASLWTFNLWGSNDTIRFNGGNGGDVITGSSRSDFIFGGLGADLLQGGAGNDTFFYGSTGEIEGLAETIDGGAGTGDTIEIDIITVNLTDLTQGATISGIEKLVLRNGFVRFNGSSFGTAPGLINSVTGGVAAFQHLQTVGSVDLSGVSFAAWTTDDFITLFGTASSETIIGSSQNDAFREAFGGTDTWSGGGGDDLFSLALYNASTGDVIDGGVGTDTLTVEDAGFELARIAITAVERLLIDSGVNSLVTAAGSQFGPGNFETIIGDVSGNTSETLIISGSVVDLSGVSFETWSSTEDLIAIDGIVGAANTLIGSSQPDHIRGDVLDDVLDGRGGTDFLSGNLGNDRYVLGADNDTVSDSGGNDMITTTISRNLADFAGIENITLLGAAAITATGSAFANKLIGNAAANTLSGLAGNDTLDGGLGVDTMRGGLGNDVYVVSGSTDKAIELASQGIDTVKSAATFTLKANVEHLTIIGTAGAKGIGNTLKNTLTGNAKTNTLDGGSNNDTLKGMGGNDVLIGGAGKDTATGGSGNDVFRFLVKTHSAGANSDTITDFDDSGNDRIDVSALFGAKMTYVHNAVFTGAGQVRVRDVSGPDVIVEVNTGGTLAADFSVRLKGTALVKMGADDFVL